MLKLAEWLNDTPKAFGVLPDGLTAHPKVWEFGSGVKKFSGKKTIWRPAKPVRRAKNLSKMIQNFHSSLKPSWQGRKGNDDSPNQVHKLRDLAKIFRENPFRTQATWWGGGETNDSLIRTASAIDPIDQTLSMILSDTEAIPQASESVEELNIQPDEGVEHRHTRVAAWQIVSA